MQLKKAAWLPPSKCWKSTAAASSKTATACQPNAHKLTVPSRRSWIHPTSRRVPPVLGLPCCSSGATAEASSPRPWHEQPLARPPHAFKRSSLEEWAVGVVLDPRQLGELRHHLSPADQPPHHQVGAVQLWLRLGGDGERGAVGQLRRGGKGSLGSVTLLPFLCLCVRPPPWVDLQRDSAMRHALCMLCWNAPQGCGADVQYCAAACQQRSTPHAG